MPGVKHTSRVAKGSGWWKGVTVPVKSPIERVTPEFKGKTVLEITFKIRKPKY